LTPVIPSEARNLLDNRTPVIPSEARNLLDNRTPVIPSEARNLNLDLNLNLNLPRRGPSLIYKQKNDGIIIDPKNYFPELNRIRKISYV
jgi:hypothetical protein